jgi:tetratricopeptide (TPR) repeat protein
MMLAVLTAAGAVAIEAVGHFAQQIHQAHAALDDGKMQMVNGEWEGAISTLQHGLSLARGFPFQRNLVDELDRRLCLAEQARAAADRTALAGKLHQLANCVRFLYGADQFPPAGLRGFEAPCRAFWENRAQVVERLSPDGAAALEPMVRDDLLDLAIFWADFQVRLAALGENAKARRMAMTVLAEADALFGPSPVLDEERRIYGEPVRRTNLNTRAPGPRRTTAPTTAWEHYALSRSLLRSGDLGRAAEEAEHAIRLQPQGLWPNFYHGLCAFRLGRYVDAVAAYSVCIGAVPEAASCFYNRALALDALGRTEQALHDYDQALRLNPTLAVAALNRAMLHYRAKRYAAAIADLQQARELGADPAIVSFDLALVNLARGEQAVALHYLRQALSHNPHQSDARKLGDSLRSH